MNEWNYEGRRRGKRNIWGKSEKVNKAGRKKEEVVKCGG